MPSLTETGQMLYVADNWKLLGIQNDTFPKLNTIGTDAIVSGNIENVFFPEIKNIGGRFEIDTSKCFDCESLSSRITKYVAGSFICKNLQTFTAAPIINPSTFDFNLNPSGSCSPTVFITQENGPVYSTQYPSISFSFVNRVSLFQTLLIMVAMSVPII
ncbi:hypothetical protein AYI68_g3583 [Smittium mucronatum]|uniref:Uncharacterized protein n=1 Tax=Smittium mucronatum TaxID=133383 RepID=A0A1R0GZQ2_9FUNG|nr:hypothetical protein AYI68_g3583 [Smittium mucronatum]